MTNNPFSAEATPAGQVLQRKGGGTSYSIPEYQREYRWSLDNIERLIEDIAQGLFTHVDTSRTSTVTFIGTIILVRDNTSLGASFKDESLSVVDGQQRLTTLVLLLSRIDAFCHDAIKELDLSVTVEKWLSTEIQTLRDELFPCLATGNFHRAITNQYDFAPKITRASNDVRAYSQNEASYESPTAKYLFSYIKFLLSERAGDLVTPPTGSSNGELESRITAINKYLNRLSSSSGDEDNTSALLTKLFDQKQFRNLYRYLTPEYGDLIRSLANDSETCLSDQNRQTALLIAFARYLLNYVQMIFVEVTDEQYAFEVFEALNTTGESLTALETFKPVVIQEEKRGDNTAGYQNSKSRDHFDRIESYINSLGSGQKQRAISADIVTSHALYFCGSKKGRHLAEQRKYLQETYLRQEPSCKRQAFVKAITDLIEYRQRFWDAPEISNLVNLGANTQTVYACACFLTASGTKLSIPVLTRFWRAYDDGKIDGEEFSEYFKAITGFVALRRAATDGTKNIDGDLRSLMDKGDLGHGSFGGLRLNGKDDLSVPAINDLQAALRFLLKRKPINITSKEDWVNKVSLNPLYASNFKLCKFLLLAASCSSEGHAQGIPTLRPVTNSIDNSYLKLETWTAEDAETVEHIAPQKNDSGWSSTIYMEPDLIHSLGNLMLLPKGSNTSLSNSGPKKKWAVYRALAAVDNEARQAEIDTAKNLGVEIKPQMEEKILKGSRLPLVTSVANFEEEWTGDVVKQRSVDIASRAWDSIAPWVGFLSR